MSASEILTLADNVTGATNGPDATILGGNYRILTDGTLGTTPKLQMKLPNGNYADTFTITAGGGGGGSGASPDNVYLPPGVVRVVLASGAAAAYVYLAKVPS